MEVESVHQGVTFELQVRSSGSVDTVKIDQRRGARRRCRSSASPHPARRSASRHLPRRTLGIIPPSRTFWSIDRSSSLPHIRGRTHWQVDWRSGSPPAVWRDPRRARGDELTSVEGRHQASLPQRRSRRTSSDVHGQARIAASLSTANIVRCTTFGQRQPSYFSQRWVPHGGTLRTIQPHHTSQKIVPLSHARKRSSPPSALRCITHTRGRVDRTALQIISSLDVSPHNVFVTFDARSSSSTSASRSRRIARARRVTARSRGRSHGAGAAPCGGPRPPM